jgi:hypothetical protein
MCSKSVFYKKKVIYYKSVFYKKERLYVTKAYIKEGEYIL